MKTTGKADPRLLGRSIEDFVPREVAQAQPKVDANGRSVRTAGNATLTEFDNGAKGEAVRAKVLHVSGPDGAQTLHATRGDGRIDEVSSATSTERGGKTYSHAESYFDLDGDGRAERKFVGAYVAPAGQTTAEALANRFYEDPTGNEQFDEAHKTIDSGQQKQGAEWKPVSSSRIYELFK